jgi:hypothetical protein
MNLEPSNQNSKDGESKVGLAGLSGVSDFFVQACSYGCIGSVANVAASNSAPIPTALWLAENEVMKVPDFYLMQWDDESRSGTRSILWLMIRFFCSCVQRCEKETITAASARWRGSDLVHYKYSHILI